jgi:non-ribosomal peptide synthase protein (TIGR01720 family)
VQTALTQQETTQLLEDIPRTAKLRVWDLLLTALPRAFTGWTGSTALLLDLEAHGRETLFDDIDVSRTVGWFTALFPVILDAGNTTDSPEALRRIQQQLRSVPHNGARYGILRYLSPAAPVMRALPSPEVSFNYLGQIERDLSASALFGFATQDVGASRSQRGQRQHLISIGASVMGGQLQVLWGYSDASHERATIERLANAYLECLRELIGDFLTTDRSYTPEDFPLANVNPAELQSILAEVGMPES